MNYYIKIKLLLRGLYNIITLLNLNIKGIVFTD